MSHRNSALLRALAASVIAPSALAFQTSTPHSNVQNQIPLSPSLVPVGSAMGSIVSGDFTGHGVQDAVFIAANRVLHVAAPGVMDNVSIVPGLTGVNDLCAVDPDGELGNSKLAVVGPNALQVLELKATGLWWNLYSVSDPAVIGALAIASGDLDGNGMPDLVVGAANALSVYALFDGGSTAQMLCQVTSPITDLQTGNFDADGQDELAVLTSTGVYVFDSSGVQLNFQRTYHPSGAIAPVTLTAGATQQFVAFVHPSQNGQNEVVHLLDGATTLPAFGLGSAFLTTIAIDAADRDADGDEDLVLTRSDTGTRTMLINSGRAPYFAIGDSESLAFEPSGGGPIAAQAALFGNFDGDDAADVLAYSRSNHEFWLRPGDPIDPVAAPRDPGVDFLACADGLYPAFYSASYEAPNYAFSEDDNTLILLVDKQAWGGWDGPQPPNAFEVFVYRNASGSDLVAGQVRAHYLFDVSGTTWNNPGPQSLIEYVLKVRLFDDSWADLSHDDPAEPIVNPGWPTLHRYFIELRAVRVTETGAITNKKRLYCAGFVVCPQTGTGSDDYTYLRSQPGQVDIPFECGYGATIGGGVKLGGFVAMSSLPDFGSNNPPLYFDIQLVSGF